MGETGTECAARPDDAADHSTGRQSGGHLLAAALKTQGAERVFTVPGESFLAALDGLRDSGIDLVTTRHEGGAAMMAEAHGKLNGRPGIAFVTRGPGATNAASGVHVAFQDSTPMLLLIGQVARAHRHREAFQEVDLPAMFAPLAKWAAEVDDAGRLPEYISRAWHIALAGRPGPVVLSLPEDVLTETTDARPLPAAATPAGVAAERDVAAILDRLDAARRPFVIVGGGGWSAAAAEALARFAAARDLPVGVSFRCQGYLDARHPCYAGDVGIGINPALAGRIRQADLILCLGARLGDMTTQGYTLIAAPDPAQPLIHVHPDPNELGRVYRPSLAVAARAGEVVRQLADASAHETPDRDPAWRQGARADYEAWSTPPATDGADHVTLERVMAHLNDALPADAILTNGAGNYAAWAHRYYRYRGWRTQLAPTSGSMGYGLPAAIAAKLACPDRDVICLAGDGCFQMVSQEFATACQYGAAIVVLICNNGMLGTIRMHQERHYPGRPVATALHNPDFAAFARAHGGYGATVRRDADVAPALAEARAAGRPALLDLLTDPAALTPRLRLE